MQANNDNLNLTRTSGKRRKPVTRAKPRDLYREKRPDIEHCDYQGAVRLKQRFEEYWLKRGYIAVYELVEKPFVPAMRSCRWEVVGQNFVNGYPTTRAA